MKTFPCHLGSLLLALGGCLAVADHRAGAAGVTVLSGSPVEVPEATFFAFDDHSIPFRRNLHLTMVAPEKHGSSVLQRGPKGSFDELRAEYYGTVIKIAGTYRMWYVGYGFADPAVRTYQGVAVNVGYAESPDGVHWTKPNLGLVEFHGNTANNIVAIEPEDYTRRYQDRNIHVLFDPEDPDPTRRYKMLMYVPYSGAGGGGRCTMVPLLSADGLRWRYAVPVKLVSESRRDQPPQPRFERSSIVMPAEHLEGGSLIKLGGIYYANGQNLNLPDGTATDRVMSTFWSSDFVHWNPEKALSFVRFNYDPRQHATGAVRTVALQGDGEQVHEGAALWNRGNVLVGIYGRWQGGKGLGSSHIDLGLITSVDAIHFAEPDPNFVFAARGKPGEWDSGGVLQGQGFQNIGGRTYIWYGSWNLTASGDTFDLAADMLASHGEIGLLTLREDGFGYFSVLDPGTAEPKDTFGTGEGSLLTAPFRVSGGAAGLFLNVDAVTSGGVAVELLDGRGVPIPGYGLADFAPLAEGGVRKAASWKNHADIPLGGPYRLRVALKHGNGGSPRLYALYVAAAPAGSGP